LAPATRPVFSILTPHKPRFLPRFLGSGSDKQLININSPEIADRTGGCTLVRPLASHKIVINFFLRRAVRKIASSPSRFISRRLASSSVCAVTRSLPPSAALHLPPPSSDRPLKGRSLKYSEGVVNRRPLRNRAPNGGGLQLSARYPRNKPPHLQSPPLRPICRDNKGKYIRDATLRRLEHLATPRHRGDHRHQRCRSATMLYKIVIKGIPVRH